MSQHLEATKGGVACLSEMGIQIPHEPTEEEVTKILDEVETALKVRLAQYLSKKVYSDFLN